MTHYFDVLEKEEYQQLKDAIALITVYIAGADGEIDQDEAQWATKVTKIRSYNLPNELGSFYQDVGPEFSDKLSAFQNELNTLEVRNQKVAKRLAALNPILAKLDPMMGAALYNSYISFAKHVAKASGGFLGFFAIGPEEAALLELKMINPIEYEEELASHEEDTDED